MAPNDREKPQSTFSISDGAGMDISEAIDSIRVLGGDFSDADWMSDESSSTDDDSDNYPLNKRLQKPIEYFQELDALESQAFENSMFQFYTDGTIYEPFEGHFRLKAGQGGSTSLRILKEADISAFYQEVLVVASEIASEIPPIERSIYSSGSQKQLDRAIENMFHFIECRNIIFWVMQSIEAMEKASYCGEFISILVVDKDRHNVARLVPIQCHRIKQLAIAFESCLAQLIGCDRSLVLLDTEMAYAKEVSEICLDLLSELYLAFPAASCTELWRCAVHVLDVAVLSYSGAHTQIFSKSRFKFFTLPGPFLEKQPLMFRRRSFLCLDEFLGGKEAWVLERYHPDAPQLNLPPLYLSADITTFADIWGPMWKTCALRNGQVDDNYILRYRVGNGVVLPWTIPSSDSQHFISCQKEEVFCHWMSDKDFDEIGDIGSSGVPLHPNDCLLIGASAKLQLNTRCSLSTDEIKQRLRDTNSLSEIGTMKSMRILDSEAVQIQVGPSYVKGSAQRTYKRRGKTWKEAWTEEWKNNPEGRNIRILEYKFGVEVSACTFNARRRRLISLLGSKTMINHLKNGALTWNSPECEQSFYAALKSPDYKAFRKLFLFHKDWQIDLGKAITYCIDALIRTGTNTESLELYWVPDTEPGHRVSLGIREHSWIGFVKDTETCCTMAILENSCLEMSNSIEARKCQSRGSYLASANSPQTDRTLNNTVLETSFMLHQNSIPTSMHPKSCRGHDGSVSSHKYVWSTSSLKGGETFSFGDNGLLMCIRPLGNGQILAKWKHPWEILEAVKEKLQGERRHWEYIRTEKGEAGPVYVLIMHSEPGTMKSLFSASETSLNPTRTRQYHWIPSRMARPRNMAGSMHHEMRQILHRWRSGELASVQHLDGSWSIIAELVAALPCGGDPAMDRPEAQ